ncbi:type III secretion system ATPase SctN [Pantoea sp. LMR881]|uniref:type III secretion system ATPase SctN n=1 Tax=Pantoea sp. LMR881 TaxID=3014336 RepID=UPI0022AFA2E2|nr:type III secretion system ATPase SctN [Pantoea sp. LMR881]MCZ4057962.1 type III secretion system ATPase SctN [Pantoea sp. LMR881]
MNKQCFVHISHPIRIQGNVVEALLPDTQIGEICEIQKSLSDASVIGYAQVIAFTKEHTLLSLLNDNQGYSRSNVFIPTGKPFEFKMHEQIAGAVLDATGNIKDRLNENDITTEVTESESLLVSGKPKDFTERKPVTEVLATGIRAIDSLLTCAKGQRVGIFAAAGCGKTSLMSMIVEHSDADIYVIGLIGERGREVTEFVEELKRSSRHNQIVVVYATSDRSCVERCNAAQIATAIAEYYSSQGKNVLLFIDSITRYARALRDLALSMGELPARRGYPASVFEALPKILERPGRFYTGSVTAFYTVLIENEEEPDVIGDEVRSILDGHIYLSKKLAAQGHYPAIDILQSISRIFQQVNNDEKLNAASRFRELMVRQQEMQLYIDLGEYRPGENPDNDEAFDKKKIMEEFLKQPLAEKTAIITCWERLYECLT